MPTDGLRTYCCPGRGRGQEGSLGWPLPRGEVVLPSEQSHIVPCALGALAFLGLSSTKNKITVTIIFYDCTNKKTNIFQAGIYSFYFLWVFFFLAELCGMRDLSFLTNSRNCDPCAPLGAQSLNNWTEREVPTSFDFKRI